MYNNNNKCANNKQFMLSLFRYCHKNNDRDFFGKTLRKKDGFRKFKKLIYFFFNNNINNKK